MKGWAAVGLPALVACLLASCGGDSSQTIFMLPSPSGSAAASGSPSDIGTPAATASPSNQAAPYTGPAPTAIAGGLHVIIDSPDGSTPITSPVEVSGTASVANGTIVVVVKDASGAELGRGTATASAAAPQFGHFDVTVSFSGATAGTIGEIRAYGVRSDGVTPTWYYFIKIHFG